MAGATTDAIGITAGAVFDDAEARRVVQLPSADGPDVEVEIDFAAVEAFEDRVSSPLASALAGRPGIVTLRGLGRHQVRLLRYLGFPLRECHDEEVAELHSTAEVV